MDGETITHSLQYEIQGLRYFFIPDETGCEFYYFLIGENRAAFEIEMRDLKPESLENILA